MQVGEKMIYPMTEPPATPYQNAVQSNVLQLRWITGQCVQIKLPDGKVLMIDPIFPHNPCWKNHLGCGVEDFTTDMIGQVDYILITHSHCDHMDGIPEVLERNRDALVLCNGIFASQASKVYGIPCRNIRPFLNGNRYQYGSFELDTFQSVHVDLGVTADPADIMEIMNSAWAPASQREGWELLNGYYGTLHGTSFLITLSNGYRIGYATGIEIQDLAREERWRKNLPNLLLRHKVYYVTAVDFAQEIASLCGQIAIPVDHESWDKQNNDVNRFACDVNEILGKMSSGVRLLVPQRYQWYRLTNMIEKC